MPTVSIPARDVYSVVTDRIVGLLERGVVPWRQPWARIGSPKSLASGKLYRGVNVFLLAAQNYASPYWLTFKQAQERGGSVRKGERGSPVVFWKWFDRDNDDGPVTDEGHAVDDADRSNGLVTRTGKVKAARCMARYYTVFNATQCDGIEYPQSTERTEFDPIPACESAVANMPKRPPIEHGGNRAFYAPSTDTVRLPERWQFRSAEAYYETLFHELTHATAHPTRCARKVDPSEWKPFGTADYSREELVAELGASFLCNHTGIVERTIENSVAYLAGWLKRLQDDKRCIVIAAAQAQKASDFILHQPAAVALAA